MSKEPILKPIKCTCVYLGGKMSQVDFYPLIDHQWRVSHKFYMYKSPSIMCVSVNEEIETHSNAFTLEPLSTMTLTV